MTRTLLAALLGLLLVPTAASAAGSALGIPCTPQPGGARFCQGSGGVEASDGEKILDLNVSLPAPPTGGTDGNYPLVIVAHGYGGSKKDFTTRETAYIPSAKEWTENGYAVLNVTDRGFGGSCGKATSPTNLPNCTKGYIRLDDARYEIRDVQYLAGKLVDEGLVNPTQIGATGESYGGGLSLMLATLRNRVMNPDGSLSPWTSPTKHTPLSLAAAVPTIPWSSLVSSLVPNGRGLDDAVPVPGALYHPAGIEKQSFVSGLFASGAASGTYAPPGTPDADLTSYLAQISAGEPYESAPNQPTPMIQSILDEFIKYRDPFELLNGEATPAGATQAPAPLLISNGFTDDLFPVDENVRYYNLVRARFPSTPISLVDMDYGHMRGANKPADTDYLRGRLMRWIGFYVRGQGDKPPADVTALTQTCPKAAASGGPFTASSWLGLSPGELLYRSPAAQTVLSSGGNVNNAKTFDPLGGGGDACATVNNDAEPGSALYRLPAATDSGYTFLGSPTITAHLAVSGLYPELTGRLLDVAPNGDRTLVARTIYRPDAVGGDVRFQLHPGAWRFAPGHAPELELLGAEPPYARKSNGTFTVTVSDLTLNIPTRETSGSGTQPAPPPPGPNPAPGPKPKPKPAGKARPGFTGPRIVTLQHRGRGSVFTSVRGTLARTRGRPCRPGKVRVSLQVNKKILVQHLPSMGRGCTFSTTLSYLVSRLGKAYRSRSEGLHETVILRYGGNRQLAAATRSRTAKVNRTPRR